MKKLMNENNTVKAVRLAELQSFKMTERQYNLATELVSELSAYIKGTIMWLGDDFDQQIITRPLIWLEREASSIIEGSMTLFEDQNDDYIHSIKDAISWEDRNLYELYKQYVSFDKKQKKIFLWNKFSVLNLHAKLYDALDSNSKYKIEDFDVNQIILNKKPGIILSNDKKPNFNAIKRGSYKDINLFFVIPSKKEQYLNYLCNDISNKLHNNDDNPLTLSDIAKFHVIFEGIHPFKDGNGRIGRLLLSMLFQNWKPIKNLFSVMNLSEFFNQNKKEYHHLLKQAQLHHKSKSAWYDWHSFFIKGMIYTKKIQIKRIDKIATIYKEFITHPKISTNPVRKKILKMFFKYYKLSRKQIVDELQGQKSFKSIYNDFNLVAKLIKAKPSGTGVFDFIELRKILRNIK